MFVERAFLLACQAHHTSDDDDIGDVDIFVLTKDGMKLTVNPLWLAHLQVSLS